MSDGNGLIRHILPKKQMSYNDVMSINSLKTYNKVMNENGYDLLFNEDETITYETYKFDGVYESTTYNKLTEQFYISSMFDDFNKSSNKVLINDIKNNCTLYDTLKNNGPNKRDYISYSCPQLTYKGKISYTITDSISYITHHPIEKE